MASAQSLLPPTARVVGHVFCADTNAPARLATVTLQPLPARTAKGKYIEPYLLSEPPTIYSVTTDMNGAFVVERVEAGSYYVIAEMPGYLSQTWQFTEQDLEFPTPDVLDRIDQSLPKVRVEQSQTAEAEVVLQRGAALSGYIRYDDGSPAAGLRIGLLQQEGNTKQNADKPVTTRQIPLNLQTDDRGHFRVAALAAGNFILKCTLRQVRFVGPKEGHQENFLSAMQRGLNEEDATAVQTMDIYFGGAFREKDATPIKLAAGTEVSGDDIVIPMSKIYRVSGIVVSLQDEHLVNSGTVELLYADDGAKVSESQIATDGSFRFALVPKGEYRLSAKAWDVQFLNRALWERRFLQGYEPGDQPLSVERNLTDVVVPMKPVSKTGDSQ